MNILLANPVVINQNSHPPLGLLYIADSLKKKGHNVFLYDPIKSNPSLFESSLKENNIDGIGFYSTASQRNELLRLAHLAKSVNNGIYTFVGGPHASSRPRDLESKEDIDYIIIGEGIKIFPELLDNLYSGKNKNEKNIHGGAFISQKILAAERVTNLDDYTPLRELADMERYMVKSNNRIRGLEISGTSILATTGCPYVCSYCSSDSIFGHNIIYRNPASVVQEENRLMNTLGVESLFYVDDTLTVNRKYFNSLLEEKINSGNNSLWAFQSRVQAVKKEDLYLLEKSGCVQEEFGAESGSQRILDLMHKHQKVEEIITAFDILSKSNIRTFANFMFDYPTETKEDIIRTFELIETIDPTICGLWQCTPYPGTKLFDEAVKNNQLKYSEEELYTLFDRMWTEKVKDFNGYFVGSDEIHAFVKEKIIQSGLDKKMYSGNWTILNQGD